MSTSETDTTEAEPALPLPTQPPPLLGAPPEHLDPTSPRFFDAAVKEAAWRRSLGIGLGVLGLTTVGFILWHSMGSVGTVLTDILKVSKDSASIDGARERIAWFAIGVHSILSIAAVFFGYSLLRAAERLLIPRHLLYEKKDVEVIRALLGMSTPANAIMTQAKAFATEALTLLKGAVDVVRPGPPQKPE